MSDSKLLPCPFCGCAEIDEYEGDYGNGVYCMECGAMTGELIHTEGHGPRVSIEEAVEAWNRRAAVTDQQFAYAVHDGKAWVCVERALESDELKPIPGFTRDSVYRDSMLEYGEWMERATTLMRDWRECDKHECDGACPHRQADDERFCEFGSAGWLSERLREFGIGEES